MDTEEWSRDHLGSITPADIRATATPDFREVFLHAGAIQEVQLERATVLCFQFTYRENDEWLNPGRRSNFSGPNFPRLRSPPCLG